MARSSQSSASYTTAFIFLATVAGPGVVLPRRIRRWDRTPICVKADQNARIARAATFQPIAQLRWGQLFKRVQNILFLPFVRSDVPFEPLELEEDHPDKEDKPTAMAALLLETQKP
jgi:hypothetical protein